ncbi:hypothetical protein ACFPOE_02010 [Caenimonas terrae]|uniref:Tyr recombinase domain-containing protein n=1 Tax=Caenimonas terrae TaxID=696074 RepID=A0ABW0NAX1_9BURK
MNPTNISPAFAYSYADLKSIGLQKLEENGVSKGVRNNYQTALNSWMKALGLAAGTRVGEEMELSFDGSWTRVMDELRLQGKSPRTIQDRCELMLRWQTMLKDMASEDNLPQDFSAALAECMRRVGMTTGDLERCTGVLLRRIRHWQTGKQRPTSGSLADVAALESGLGLKAGTLSSRLPRATSIRAALRAMAEEGTTCSTAFGARMKTISLACLKYSRQPDGKLLEQWRDLIAYKVDVLRDGVRGHDVWRLKALKSSGCRLNNSNVWEGKVCSAADACWGFLGGYFGWLSLEKVKGGAGIERERVDSLAWLLRKEKVFEYFNWQQRRAGLIHKGLLQTLNACCMLLRPETGWIWLNDELIGSVDERDAVIDVIGLTAGARQNAWRAKCAELHSAYAERVARLESTGSIKPSRDKWEAIQDIVSSKRPLQEVARMIAQLERMEPLSSARMEHSTWTRDVLLLKMLSSNPLRVQHFAVMKYTRDNKGNIYRKAEGGWGLRYDPSDFKNERFASQEAYNANVPQALWPDIERYLNVGRPNLAAADSPYFFLRAPCGPASADDSVFGCDATERYGMWRSEGMTGRIRQMTAVLRPGRPGFGPHSFRHICATDFLKRFPGAYALVAKLLHDKLTTVLRDYGHLEVQDGLDRHFEAFTSELEAARL